MYIFRIEKREERERGKALKKEVNLFSWIRMNMKEFFFNSAY
jgi:hypothetical protein